jgi:hypothetical protein
MPPVIEAVAAVSFADTPRRRSSRELTRYSSLGWTIIDRGDPWVILVAKHVDESEREPEAELRDVMGDYWVDTNRMRELLTSPRTRCRNS